MRPGRIRVFVVFSLLVGSLAAAAVAGGCGSSDEDDDGAGAPSASEDPAKVAWLGFGPKNDNGFAEVHWEAFQAVDKALGDQVDQVWTDNVPFSEEATQITERHVADGVELIIDTGAIGDLFLDVCKETPDLHCVEQYFVGELPDNVSTYYTKFWNQQYLLGVAAGELTESGTLGFAAPFKIPLVKAAINAWTLGCQSVRPDCATRIIYINTWYDPPKSNQATSSLIDAGADVVNSFVSDPGYCQVAEKRGVWAAALYRDWSSFCPNAYYNTMWWDFNEYFEDEVRMEVEGEWTGGRRVLLDIEDGAGLGPWGKRVPAAVKTKVDEVMERMRGGENVFAGPIADQSGKVRIAAGDEASEDFLYSGWDWLVEGVIGG